VLANLLRKLTGRKPPACDRDRRGLQTYKAISAETDRLMGRLEELLKQPEPPPAPMLNVAASDLRADEQQKIAKQQRLPPGAVPCWYGRVAEHSGEEQQRRFIAKDPDNPWRRGHGSIFSNGDVVIQWLDAGHLEIPAGNDWQPYFADWNQEQPVY